jgi:hypothetical protein
MWRSIAPLAAAAGLLAIGSLAQAQCPGELIHSPLRWHDAWFGGSVQLEGDVAVVGDRGDHTFIGGSGAVHTYRLVEGVWKFESTVFHSRISERDGFGGAVALDGPDRFAASAGGEDAAGFAVGAAYIFEHNGEAWHEVAEILPPIFEGHNGFGSAVALRGDTLAVSGPSFIVGEVAAGAVYIFREEDGRWEFKQLLVAPDPRLGARFGNALALDGGWLMVGAPWDKELGHLAGAVYLYRRSAESDFKLVEKLPPPNPGDGPEFGWSLALDGATLAVGAPNSDGLFATQGAVFVYRFLGEEWRLEQRLDHDPIGNDALGASVAMRRDILVAGAPRHYIPERTYGAAYAFQRRPDGSWRQAAKLLPESFGASFGWSTATDGASVIVGSPEETVGGAPATGAAHIFDLGCLLCRADLDGDGELTFLDFLAFQALFAAGDMTADFDGSGVLDFFDFLAFQDEFAAGCK